MDSNEEECKYPGCVFKEQSSHLHIDVVYDSLVAGAAETAEKVKDEVIFGLLAELDNLFEEKKKKKEKKTTE